MENINKEKAISAEIEIVIKRKYGRKQVVMKK